MKKQVIEWNSISDILPQPEKRVFVRFDDGSVDCLWQDWKNNMDDGSLNYDYVDVKEGKDISKRAIEWAYIPDPDENILRSISL